MLRPHLAVVLRGLLGIDFDLLPNSFVTGFRFLHHHGLLENVNVEFKQWIFLNNDAYLLVQQLKQFIQMCFVIMCHNEVNKSCRLSLILCITLITKESSQSFLQFEVLSLLSVFMAFLLRSLDLLEIIKEETEMCRSEYCIFLLDHLNESRSFHSVDTSDCDLCLCLHNGFNC